jgi:hypothetical protein
MRVNLNGFQTQATEMMVAADGRLDVELQPVSASGSLSGEYRLTITASPSCVLPPDVMQRSYDARILEVGQDLRVLLSGANLIVWGGQPGFTGTRNQDTVRFVVTDTFDDAYNFIERIDQERVLYYAGTAVGSVEGAQIVATFTGKLDLQPFANAGVTPASCVADHRFEFTRSGTRPQT